MDLDASYKYCRDLNRRYGSTYYWATALLPRGKRLHVHALYAFCRYADDIVDVPETAISSTASEQALTDFGDRLFNDLDRGTSDDPVLKAVINTVDELHIDPKCFARFLHSMHMDFSHSTYETFDDLMEYMDGSAAVIGEMMLPILEPTDAAAFEPARQLGIAFQLTNFLRDVGEDLDRGRVYLPQETLRSFGAEIHHRKVTPEWRAAMAFEIDRARAIYEVADVGIGMLPEESAKCVAAARRLYSGILDRIEKNDYDVFSQRARVPRWQKLAAAVQLVS